MNIFVLARVKGYRKWELFGDIASSKVRGYTASFRTCSCHIHICITINYVPGRDDDAMESAVAV